MEVCSKSAIIWAYVNSHCFSHVYSISTSAWRRGGGCTSISCGYVDVPPVKVYLLRTCVLSGYTFLPIFLVGVLSGMLFNLIVSYVFPQGIQSHAFWSYFMFSQGQGHNSVGLNNWYIPSLVILSRGKKIVCEDIKENKSYFESLSSDQYFSNLTKLFKIVTNCFVSNHWVLYFQPSWSHVLEH